MGSLGNTLVQLQCSQLDTWGSKEQELYLHFDHTSQGCYPYHDCRPSSSRIHCLQRQVLEVAVAAIDAIAAGDSVGRHIALGTGQGLLGLVAE